MLWVFLFVCDERLKCSDHEPGRIEVSPHLGLRLGLPYGLLASIPVASAFPGSRVEDGFHASALAINWEDELRPIDHRGGQSLKTSPDMSACVFFAIPPTSWLFFWLYLDNISFLF